MARKRTKAPRLIEPPKYHAHIGKDPKGRLCFLGLQADGKVQPGGCLTPVAIVDVGRQFELHIPSGLVIEGMPADIPWTASAVLTGVRHGWFGLKIVE